MLFVLSRVPTMNRTPDLKPTLLPAEGDVFGKVLFEWPNFLTDLRAISL